MNYKNPNLVMNKPEIFLDITFGLNFMSDVAAARELRNHFLTEECTYPDVNLMRHYIQEYADESRDYLNRLYDLQIANLTYNPVENYDRHEEWSDDENTGQKNTSNRNEKGSSNTSGTGDAFEFPMNSNDKKQTSHTDTASEGDYSSESTESGDISGTRNGKHTGRIHGNIGVTTGAQMIEGEAKIAEIIYRLKVEFCKQYNDLFMITI